MRAQGIPDERSGYTLRVEKYILYSVQKGLFSL